jgi:cytochrome c-type biogenesis protein CcmH
MTPTPTDWTSAIVIGIAGIILGALFIYLFNRKKAAPTIEGDLERKDLEAKRDALIAQLRALPDDAVDERARLEADTAIVLRQLDQRHAPAAATRAPASAAGAPASQFTKGFLWGAGSAAALAALLFFVYQAATPRPEGEGLTGGIGNPQQQQQQQQPQAAASTDPMVIQLEQAVQKDPNNSKLRLDLAQMYLERENLMGVFEQTKVVLDREPQNPRALTFGALVRMAMGESETAVQMLQQATKVEPSNLDAWVAMAWIHAQTGKMNEAESAIAQASRVSPENKGRLEEVLSQMKAHVQQQRNAPQTAQGAMPPDHPQVGGAPAPAAAAGGARVQVTLQIDPAARAKTGIVFVVARPLSGGPPVAVKRMQVGAFPVTFELTSADSMMGQPLPDKFRLEARLDSDGNATTKPPTDPSAMQAEVVSGAAVTLALK